MSGSFVPKLSKSKRDAIIECLEQGYTHKETAEKVGVSRNTVGKINKEIKKEVVSHNIDPNALSTESLAHLSNIQGLLGKKSLDETVDAIFKDYTTIMPIKYELDLDFSKSLSEVFNKSVELHKDYETQIKNIHGATRNTFIQTIVLRNWGMSWSVRALYDVTWPGLDNQISLVEFIERAVIASFTHMGWQVETYYNSEYDDNYPILTTPDGKRIVFPSKENGTLTQVE